MDADYPNTGVNLACRSTVEAYDKVQERRKGGAKAPTRKDIGSDFALRGFVACGDCNEPYTACWSKGKYKEYPYYLCDTKGCSSYHMSKPPCAASLGIRSKSHSNPSQAVEKYGKAAT